MKLYQSKNKITVKNHNGSVTIHVGKKLTSYIIVRSGITVFNERHFPGRFVNHKRQKKSARRIAKAWLRTGRLVVELSTYYKKSDNSNHVVKLEDRNYFIFSKNRPLPESKWMTADVFMSYAFVD